MAITFIDGATQSDNTGTNGSPSIVVPATAQNGDVLIAVLNNAGTGFEAATTPSGWTSLADISGSTAGRMSVITRTMATGVTAATWTLAAANPGPNWGKLKMTILVLRGAGTLTAGTTFTRSATGTTTALPSVTTTTANEWVVGVWGDRVSQQTSAAADAAMTERVKYLAAENGGASIIMATELRASTGATGTRTATYGVTSANGYGLLIRVAPVAGTPPVVNAGPAQTVTAGSNVVLSGASSTGTTHSWTVLSGPASPTINNSTSLTTANLTPTVAGHYVIRLSSTNTDGTTTSDKTLYVNSNAATPDSTPSNPGGYVIQGGSATIDAALADNSDGTYAESVDPSSGDVFTVGITPLVTGAVTVTTRAKSSTTPVLQMTVDLMQGTTVIATSTFTTTTSFSDYSFTTTSGQTANITDFNNLRVRITCV